VVELPVRMTLEARHRRVDRVYFPERGMASVVANGSGRSGVEIGVIRDRPPVIRKWRSAQRLNSI
jgi:hypothetical protein